DANVIRVNGKRRRQLADVADRELMREWLLAVRCIEDDDPGIPQTRSRRIKLLEQIAVDDWTVDEHRVGGNLPVAGTGVRGVVWKQRNDRCREFPKLDRILDRSQQRAVVEDPVARTHERLSGGIKLAREPDSRRKVVAVDRVLLAGTEQRIVALVHRNDLEVV